MKFLSIHHIFDILLTSMIVHVAIFSFFLDYLKPVEAPFLILCLLLSFSARSFWEKKHMRNNAENIQVNLRTELLNSHHFVWIEPVPLQFETMFCWNTADIQVHSMLTLNIVKPSLKQKSKYN